MTVSASQAKPLGGSLAPKLRLPAIGRFLAIIHESITQGTWQRLKVCRNDICRWAFYDSSRNRSGAWCTMAICGNRMKGRTFRSRHPAPATG